ncbi:General negative regulator of transcription subunit 3 [Meyerozyma sp. JA9]|nr:General negative regulator of transcription subunit 3 [Meyerozyma sp. JA9]
MAHRKLQKYVSLSVELRSVVKPQGKFTNIREVDAIFKKINEGCEIFNYYYTRHEGATNDSQREKLEGDLKKEIKKLQKYRDQIKTWQSNDAIEAAIAPQKLQEHRKMVEEAMECYKDVEKSSKMKSYSNQSIMLAALEQGEFQLTPEAADAVEFLEASVDELNEQNEALEGEYDKLSQKKTRKTNTATEERKQELESFMNKNTFHIERLEHIVHLLKRRKVSPESVMAIQDDISFYLESNQEPDFVDDENLYDELFKEASQASELAEQEQANTSAANDSFAELNVVTPKQSPEPDSDHKSKESSAKHDQKRESETHKTTSSASTASPPAKVLTTPNSKQSHHTEISTPDVSSPGIIKVLKPAATPQKPLGTLKWAAAAAGPLGAQGNGHVKDNSESSPSPPASAPLPTRISSSSASSTPPAASNHPPHSVPPMQQAPYSSAHSGGSNVPIQSPLPKSAFASKYVPVLNNSTLSKEESALFQDVNLIRLPPGIQDLILSFTTTRKVSVSPSREEAKLLRSTSSYSQFKCPIQKPYLPKIIQTSFYQHEPDFSPEQHIRPPLQLLKSSSSWNQLRAGDLFESYVRQIQNISPPGESVAVVNEMTMVLFYGYYYGITPLENIIAESCLYQLGWKPYASSSELKITPSGSRSETPTPGRLSPFDSKHYEPAHYYHWFNRMKLLQPAENDGVEFGDYRVFDLNLWEINVKHGFRFDLNQSQAAPSQSIC